MSSGIGIDVPLLCAATAAYGRCGDGESAAARSWRPPSVSAWFVANGNARAVSGRPGARPSCRGLAGAEARMPYHQSLEATHPAQPRRKSGVALIASGSRYDGPQSIRAVEVRDRRS